MVAGFCVGRGFVAWVCGRGGVCVFWVLQKNWKMLPTPTGAEKKNWRRREVWAGIIEKKKEKKEKKTKQDEKGLQKKAYVYKN